VAAATPPAPQPLDPKRQLRLHDGFVSGLRVHVSHYGYHPEHPKEVFCLGLPDAAHFEVCRADNGDVCFSGALQRHPDDDFGDVRVGDFSTLRVAGRYFVRVGTERSFGTFTIAAGLWDDYQRLIALHYFGVHRIGEDNIVGNGGDFQGVRWDDAQYPGGVGWRYIGRGWADGDDLRIYPSMSLVVAQYCRLRDTQPFWDKGDWIYQQVRWGLDGALSFLDHDGILRWMLRAFPDRATDGRFYSGNQKFLCDAFDCHGTSNEYSLANREVVFASLLIGPAEAALAFRERDPAFFDRVVHLCEIGVTAIARLSSLRKEGGVVLPGEDDNPFAGKYSSAAAAWLSAVLHRLTGNERYATAAAGYADELLACQQRESLGDGRAKLSGWFRRTAAAPANPWGEKPEQEVMITPWIYQGLFRLLELLPGHPRASAWREAIRAYAADYLAAGARLNVFGYTPMKVGTAGLKRTRGTLAYQYFAGIGRQFHQIGNAAFLLQAGQLLGDRALVDAGWRQIQWFAGANPLGFGCIYGLSANIAGGQYLPETWGRACPGGTVNGLNGDEHDRPAPRFWEYYTYANLNALWFATVAGSRRFAAPLELWPKEIAEAPHDPAKPGHPLLRFPVRFKGGCAYPLTAAQATPCPLRWLVDGRPGGDDTVGRVDNAGVFTAPFVTAVRRVILRVECADDPAIADETAAEILPVPRAVPGLRAERHEGGVRLRWTPLVENCSGYTVWQRLPVIRAKDDSAAAHYALPGPEQAGTIFQRIWAVDAPRTECTLPIPAAAGTEFMVRAYHRSATAIYGYGPESAPVMLT
jgi:hypothetical protein